MDIHKHSRLQWVIVAEDLVHVSEFAGLKPQERPTALCPVCSRPVIMKLGPEPKKKAHHFAHRPGDECAARHPETALHINAKYHLYRELQHTQILIALEGCETENCGATRKYALLADWDRVEVEHRIDTRRPDLVLLQEEQAIGAIEVFVTHKTEEEKAEYLHSLGIHLVEMLGKAVLPPKSDVWRAEQPLPVYYQHPARAAWKCNGCLRREAAKKRQEEYQKHNYSETLIKIVDFFYPNGKKYRELFRITRRVEKDRTVELWLEKGVGERKTMVAHGASRDDVNKTFHDALDYQRRQRGAVVDSCMRWQKGTSFLAAKRILSNGWFPSRYRWEVDHWESPEENRDICWDGYWDNYEQYRDFRVKQAREQKAERKAQQRADYLARQETEREQYLHEFATSAPVKPTRDNLAFLVHYRRIQQETKEETEQE